MKNNFLIAETSQWRLLKNTAKSCNIGPKSLAGFLPSYVIPLWHIHSLKKIGVVLNSQGRNLGRSVTSASISGLTSIQGDLGESGKGI